MDAKCIEVRRELTTDPQTRDADILQHLNSCTSCSDYLKELRLFDTKLAKAIKVEVPEGLESRILLAQKMGQPPQMSRQSKWRDYTWMSLAAGLVVAIGITIGAYKLGESHGIEREVLAHIYEDIYALDRNDNIELASLNKILKPHGIQADAGIGHIRYAANCPIGDKTAPHMVLDDDQGKAVTVMYIPWKDSFKRMPFDDERFNGVLVGAEQGSFIIVSENQQSLKPMEDRVIKSIEIRI